MAGYRGHIAGAVTCGTIYVAILGVASLSAAALDFQVGKLTGWQFIASVYVVCILFGLWPDIDTNSKGQDIFFGIAFLADILLILYGYLESAAYLGLLAMTPIVGKHRGWTHSKIAMLIIPLPILIVPTLYSSTQSESAAMLYGAAVVGYFSHLLLDGLIFKHFRIKG